MGPIADWTIDRHDYRVWPDQFIVDYALHWASGNGALEDKGAMHDRYLVVFPPSITWSASRRSCGSNNPPSHDAPLAPTSNGPASSCPNSVTPALMDKIVGQFALALSVVRSGGLRATCTPETECAHQRRAQASRLHSERNASPFGVRL